MQTHKVRGLGLLGVGSLVFAYNTHIGPKALTLFKKYVGMFQWYYSFLTFLLDLTVKDGFDECNLLTQLNNEQHVYLFKALNIM